MGMEEGYSLGCVNCQGEDIASLLRHEREKARKETIQEVAAMLKAMKDNLPNEPKSTSEEFE